VLFCIRLPNFVQIGTSIATAEILRHIVFQDGGRQPCCICFGVMADLKSLIRRINCSVNIAIYRFWPFGLKLPTHSRPFFGGVFGASPIWRHSSSWPRKNRPWRKHLIWAIQRKNLCIGSTWVQDREKRTGQQKSHKSVIFPVFRGKAPLGRFDPKVAWWVMSTT